MMITFDLSYANCEVKADHHFDVTEFYIVSNGVKLVVAIIEND